MRFTRLHYSLAALAVAAVFAVSALYVSADAGKRYKSMKGEDAWLGVYMQNVDEELVEAFDLQTDKGVLIDDVVDESPADEAGLHSGDVIIEMDGDEIVDSDDVTRIIGGHDPGDEVEVKILRNGKEKTYAVELGTTSEHGQAIMLYDDAINLGGLPGMKSFQLGNGGGYLGVSTMELSDQLADYFGTDQGVLVTDVDEDTPAAEAGIKAGDIITAVNDEAVDSPDELRKVIRDHDKGDEVTVKVIRKEQPLTLTATLDETEGIRWYGAFDGSTFTVPSVPSIPNLDKLEVLRYFDNEEFQDEMEELRQELKELQKELEVIKEKLE